MRGTDGEVTVSPSMCSTEGVAQHVTGLTPAAAVSRALSDAISGAPDHPIRPTQVEELTRTDTEGDTKVAATVVKAIPLTCTGHSRPVTHLSFSPMLADLSFLLVSACKDGNPMLRNGVTGDWIGTFLGHKGAIWCVRLNKDGTRAVSASADFSVNVWNTTDGSVVASLPHGHIVRTCDFLEVQGKGLQVITGGDEKIVRIWDVESASVVREWPVSGPLRVILTVSET
jgi:WD40 repeat protein